MLEAASMVLASHEHWEGHGGEWWPIFPIFWILFFFGLFWFIGRRKRACWGGSGRSSGRSVLAERFAKGEISEQEYRDRLKVLSEERR